MKRTRDVDANGRPLTYVLRWQTITGCPPTLTITGEDAMGHVHGFVNVCDQADKDMRMADTLMRFMTGNTFAGTDEALAEWLDTLAVTNDFMRENVWELHGELSAAENVSYTYVDDIHGMGDQARKYAADWLVFWGIS